MTAFARQQWFLLALAGVLVLGVMGHALLAPVAAAIPRDLLVAAVMLAMSAPLDLRRSLSSRSAVSAAAIGVAVNAGAAGPIAWVGGRALVEPLAVGLVVACLAPCTLASAAVWTRRGRGNEAVALAVTVVTNLFCFVTLPFWAWVLLGESQSVDAVALGSKLLMVAVAPIALGQLLRLSPGFCRIAAHRRARLALAAQLGLLGMVFIAAVGSGELLTTGATGISTLQGGLLALVAAAVHLSLFAIAWAVARFLRLPRAEALGAAVGGSQKTLAIGLTIALEFGPLAILPMLYYHALQLLADEWLVQRLGPRGPEESGDPRA